MDFTDTVALVTGSSRGIGRAIALQFAWAGAAVVINYRQAGGRSENLAHDLAAEVGQLGRRALAVQADIGVREDRERLIAEVENAFHRLDFLILNAARAPFKPVEKMLEREWRQLVETNFIGQVLCLRAALPLLEKARGSAVFISSLGSRFYLPGYPLGAMKAAMEALVRHWAESIRGRGVNVNAVCGGVVKTDALKVHRQFWEGLERFPEELLLEPEEIAEVVLFLCTPAARGIRGQTVVVDRGLSNRFH